MVESAVPSPARNERLCVVFRVIVPFGAVIVTSTWLVHSGFIRVDPTPAPLWVIAAQYVLYFITFDTWFYWLHRLIHTRLFYRKVHQWHHLTVPPVVWSNNSDRLVDNLFLQSYWLFAHFLLPAAPVVLFVHKLYDQITGIIGHSGHEHGGRWCWPPSPNGRRHSSRPAPSLFLLQLRDPFQLVGSGDGHAPSRS